MTPEEEDAEDQGRLDAVDDLYGGWDPRPAPDMPPLQAVKERITVRGKNVEIIGLTLGSPYQKRGK